MAKGVRADELGDPRPAGDPAHDPPGAVPVEAPAIRSKEDRPFGALTDGQVDRQREGDDLAALASDDQGAVAAFDAQGLDIGS